MGGKSKTKSKSNEKFEAFAPVVDRVENSLLPGIDRYSNDYQNGEGLYSGSRLGAQDPNVTAGQDALLAAGGQYGEDFQKTRETLQGFLDYDPDSPQNQASRDALRANASAQFNEVIRPGVEDIGTSSGQFGGNQQNLALGAATAPLSRAIADNEFNLMNADKTRAFQAMLAANGINEGGFVEGQVQEGVGNARTRFNQLENMDEIQMFEAERNNRLRSLAEEQGLLMPLSTLGSTSEGSSSSTTTDSPIKTAVGLGAIAADMYTGGGVGAIGGLLGKGSVNDLQFQDEDLSRLRR
jgi:hypothetical protein